MSIEHFGRQADLGLDYIKLDARFIGNLEPNTGNQAFLKRLTTIAKDIGLKVIAEGVTSESKLATLPSVGFDEATEPVIQEPRA